LEDLGVDGGYNAEIYFKGLESKFLEVWGISVVTEHLWELE
jgi:hypothetical protein